MLEIESDRKEVTIEKIRTHLNNNKKVYLIGVGCLIVGAIGGVAFSTKSIQIVDNLNIKIKSPTTNTVITILERRACMEPIPVRCVETGEVFGSIRRAGELLKLPRRKIGSQLIGKLPSVGGLTFEFVNLAE